MHVISSPSETDFHVFQLNPERAVFFYILFGIVFQHIVGVGFFFSSLIAAFFQRHSSEKLFEIGKTVLFFYCRYKRIADCCAGKLYFVADF